jgi:inosine/xanthosine triphosphate pyrophosphatase family protein
MSGVAEVRVVMCTQNEGKLTEVRKYFEARQFSGDGSSPVPRFVVLSPAEAGLPKVDVEEDQPTLEGNAAKKAREHFQHLSPSTPSSDCGACSLTVVVADDTSLEIEALGGEPGIKVRRWKDGVTSMTDEGIIEHCIARMQGQINRYPLSCSIFIGRC